MTDCEIGYYGKLPVSAEFLRKTAAGAEIDQLDQWAREGILYAKTQVKQDWDVVYARAGVWNFLLAPEGGTRILVGVCMPSRDQAGRDFPFFVFLRVSRDSFKADPALAPWACATFLSEARDVVLGLAACGDLHECRGRLDSGKLPAMADALSTREAYEQALAGHSMKEFWAQMLGEFNHPGKFRIDRDLRDCLLPLRGQRPRRLTWGLKFPLVPDQRKDEFDLPFWLDWMGRILAEAVDPVLLLWNRTPAHARPCMVVTLNRPSSKLFRFLLQPEAADDAWYELAPEAKGGHTTEAIEVPADRRVLLEEGDISIGLFLQSLSRA